MIKHLTILVVFILMITSCTEKTDTPDVSHINDDVNIIRYEQLLFNIDTSDIESGIEALKRQYPAFSNLYFSQILPFSDQEGNIKYEIVHGFLKDSLIRDLYIRTEKTFGDFEKEERALKSAVQHLKYYFPNVQIPNYYTLISEYGFQNFIFSDGNKDGIGIGLDMFLGNDFDYKNLDPTNPSFSEYLTRTYNQDHLVKKSLEMLVEDILGEPNGKRLIDFMIFYGKKLYILDKIMPQVQDSIILDYSAKQVDWVYENEREMWSFFLDQNLLYETSLIKTGKYFNPAPSSTGMPEEAPGRTAQFIGRQIVRKYMERFPEKSLEQLISEYDAQKLLEKSKYKPKRK